RERAPRRELVGRWVEPREERLGDSVGVARRQVHEARLGRRGQQEGSGSQRAYRRDGCDEAACDRDQRHLLEHWLPCAPPGPPPRNAGRAPSITFLSDGYAAA